MPFLINILERKQLKFRDIELKDGLSIGRNADNQVVLAHDSVSRHHATFHVESRGEAQHVTLRDKDSTNGCIVNGRLLRGDSAEVRPGDSITIGVYRVELHQDAAAPTAQPRDSGNATIVCEVQPPARERPEPGRLDVIHGPALLESAARTISQSFPFEALYMNLEREPGFPTVLTRDENGACPPDRLSVNKPLVSRATREGVALLARSRTGELRPAEAGSGEQDSQKSVLCVPVFDGERNCGVVYLRGPAGVAYTREHLQLLIVIAGHLGANSRAASLFQDTRNEKNTLEAILGTLPDGVVLANGGFEILACNTAACAALGGDEVIGKNLGEVLRSFDPTFSPRHLVSQTPFCIEQSAKEHDPQGGPSSTAQTRVYAGSWGRNTTNEDGEWRYVLCLHDISEQKHDERARLRFVKRLARRIISPLTSVTAMNSLLVEQTSRVGDPQLVATLDESRKQSELCAKLIRRFVDFASLSCSAPGSLAGWKRHALEDLVASAAREITDLIREKRFKVVNLFRPGTVVVEGHEDRLRVIFAQVIHNAVKFGKQGGTLMIGAKPERERIHLSFLDDGPGIALSENEGAGKILCEVDPMHAADFPEMGIGLWLVNEAARYHGGKLTISSPANEDGTGTLVQVSLPGSSSEQPEPDLEMTAQLELGE